MAPKKKKKVAPAAEDPGDETVRERSERRARFISSGDNYDTIHISVGIHAIFVGRREDTLKTEFWRDLSRNGGSARQQTSVAYEWGKDWAGNEIGELPHDTFERQILNHTTLIGFDIAQRRLNFQRDRLRRLANMKQEPDENLTEKVKQDSIVEMDRRRGILSYSLSLFGEEPRAHGAADARWDDITPREQDPWLDSLASIHYPPDYSDAIGRLRAVMDREEYSLRCLELTEKVIKMNPAHYTVWLYRFKIIKLLKLPPAEELFWLNGISIANPKNYQIWHHRQLMLDLIMSRNRAGAIDEQGVAMTDDELIDRERGHITRMLDVDNKNYHVWSYRQYLTRKLAVWPSAGERGQAELRSTRAMIAMDERNNSAWAHLFFLVFSDPAISSQPSDPFSPDCRAATDPDPAIPADIIDRECRYASDKIRLAPQNQSGWNYLRGVLAKGGRPLSAAQALAEEFFVLRKGGIGSSGEIEDLSTVKSSHALEMMADVHEAQGRKNEAVLLWTLLATKWDPIRANYWRYRIRSYCGGGEQASEEKDGEKAPQEEDEEAVKADKENAEEEEKTGAEKAAEEITGGEKAVEEAREEKVVEEKAGEENVGEKQKIEEEKVIQDRQDAAGEEKGEEEQAGKEKGEEKKAGDERTGEENAGEKNLGEEKAREEEAGDEKSGEKESEEKAGEEEVGEEKGDEEKAGEKKGEEEKAGEEKASEEDVEE